ncbi:Bug family tripartite tricarboxylate transporter substrate binding protein [Variovorax ginsengisoli]|uniref:Tripartite tricarboxylate transporter substrate binding protein n=1 Tax=Variovorax ginsengisoli TaxID=363844 RepID=A0ABT8SD79_9BURK|nr:tripartite tricarboxylate transporter substrate binding protein [Variovorax ginsengisoli]MDN8617704.1 tripartite tricarboxylate transporter substrate binding protein [Variovorax ginsengisoli]MDO1536874.1 tripartite tricarboxylate transporter substrate binding protein [Variovorax ginsengisoli]
MIRNSRPGIGCWLLAAAALFQVNHATATEESWPAARPIRMVIPAGAGAGTDIFARLIGTRLGQALKQTIVYDNKPGANGIIGNDSVAKSVADGYTILFSNASAVAVNPAIQPKLPYQTLKDLVPIAQIGAGGVLLVTTPDVGVSDMKGLVRYLKSNPGKLGYGTWGMGSTGHLSMEALKAKEGLNISHVPYKTMGQVLTDLQGGTLQIAFVDASSPLALIKAGKLVPLGVTGSHRLPALAGVPTMQEQGYRLGADGWYGLFAPFGTPQPVIQRLNLEINQILAAPDMRPVLEAWNLSRFPIKTPAEFAQTVREDLEQWKEIATTAHVTLE